MKKMALAPDVTGSRLPLRRRRSDDTGNGNDAIYVDYGAHDDTSRPDIQIPPFRLFMTTREIRSIWSI